VKGYPQEVGIYHLALKNPPWAGSFPGKRGAASGFSGFPSRWFLTNGDLFEGGAFYPYGWKFKCKYQPIIHGAVAFQAINAQQPRDWVRIIDL